MLLLQTVYFITTHVYLPSPTAGPVGSQSSVTSETGEHSLFILYTVYTL